MNPLSCNNGLYNFHQISVKSNQEKAAQEAFNQRMYIFQGKDDDIEDVFSQLESKISEHKKTIPSDNPFSDTDLVVLEDKYTGRLPVNAIKEKDLNFITELYRKIADQKSDLLVTKGKDGLFKKEILSCIKILMTREIGRKLIKKITNLGFCVKINPGKENQAQGNVIEININNAGDSLIRLDPSGKLTHAPNPLFISLGHEMIHIIHKNITRQPSNLDDEGGEYDNMEEQITITGLAKRLIITNIFAGESDWVPTFTDYDELNERNLTASYTGALTEYSNDHEERRYPRVGHRSIELNKSIQQTLRQYVMGNVTKDLEETIRDNSIDKEILNMMFKAGELHTLAIQYGRKDVLNFLLKIDPKPNLPEEASLLLVACGKIKNASNKSTLHSMVDSILKAGANPNCQDLNENTPLYYFIKLENWIAAQMLIKKGASLKIQNCNGLDPIENALLNISEGNSSTKDRIKNLIEFMNENCSQKEIIDKLKQPAFAKLFFSFAEQNLVLEYLDLLQQSGHDFYNLDKKGNSTLHYAVFSCESIVIDKLKQYNLNLKNTQGQTPADYLIQNNPKFVKMQKIGFSIKDAKIYFESVYETLKALNVNLNEYQDRIRNAARTLDASLELYVKNLWTKTG